MRKGRASRAALFSKEASSSEASLKNLTIIFKPQIALIKQFFFEHELHEFQVLENNLIPNELHEFATDSQASRLREETRMLNSLVYFRHLAKRVAKNS